MLLTKQEHDNNDNKQAQHPQAGRGVYPEKGGEYVAEIAEAHAALSFRLARTTR